MRENDPELRRLKEIERLARERFLRLSLPGSFAGMPKSSRPRKRFGGKRLPLSDLTATNDSRRRPMQGTWTGTRRPQVTPPHYIHGEKQSEAGAGRLWRTSDTT
jgi:hypothetical protein